MTMESLCFSAEKRNESPFPDCRRLIRIRLRGSVSWPGHTAKNLSFPFSPCPLPYRERFRCSSMSQGLSGRSFQWNGFYAVYLRPPCLCPLRISTDDGDEDAGQRGERPNAASRAALTPIPGQFLNCAEVWEWGSEKERGRVAFIDD